MTADLSRATPRPWSLMDAGTSSGNGTFHLYLIEGSTGRKIAAIWGKEEEKSETGALIVQAVNERDAQLAERDKLIAALRTCVEALEAHGVHPGSEFNPECDKCNAVDTGRAILAKIEAAP